MGEQVCTTGVECRGGAAGVETYGYPVETTGNACSTSWNTAPPRVPSRVMTTTAPWR